MFCEYAKEFVNAMQKANGEMPHEDHQAPMLRSHAVSSHVLPEDQVKLSDRCCKQNSVYQILYPDPTLLVF